MPNAVTRHISNELYMAAGLLVLFGFAKSGVAGPNHAIQLMLAAACAGAAIVVRQGGPTGRIAGFAAAGSTVAFGALSLWTGRGFVPGSIISVYALVRLFGSGDAFGGAVSHYGTAQPGQHFQANATQPTPGVHVVSPTAPAAYSPQWALPAAGQWPPAQAQQPQWSPAQLQQFFAPPAGQLPPPPPAPAPPPPANR